MNKVRYQYPNTDEYEYESVLEIINEKKDKEYNLLYENGFIIDGIQSSLKKDMKNPNGIYSSKFGPTLQDMNPFCDKNRCECRNLRGRGYLGQICPKCHTRVRYYGDDLKIMGWIVIKEPTYSIFHPNLFKTLQSFIGKEKLDHIISYIEYKDENGHKVVMPRDKTKATKDEPFYGLGMIDMKPRIKEILDFYNKGANPSKRAKYNHLINNLDNLFINDIPVMTTLLRPYEVTAEKFVFEGTNKFYNMMTRIAYLLNGSAIKSCTYSKKTPNQLLYDLNAKYQELYAEIEDILNGKKGQLRGLFQGRAAFSGRAVIVGDWKLRTDEVIMSYQTCVECMQPTIINMIRRRYSMTYSQAYQKWQMAQFKTDEDVVKIIRDLIKYGNGKTGKDYVPGIPILINRPPTISYGSILYQRIIDITFSYTMKLSLGILPNLAADFDYLLVTSL